MDPENLEEKYEPRYNPDDSKIKLKFLEENGSTEGRLKKGVYESADTYATQETDSGNENPGKPSKKIIPINGGKIV